jgi:hypothetical protein
MNPVQILIFLIAVAIGGGIVAIASRHDSDDAAECAARGGVLVRAVGSGYQCVQVAR